MMNSVKRLLLLCAIFLIGGVAVQATPSGRSWSAAWIAAPGDEGLQYGVYYFRKNIRLDAVPERFEVCVSADNQYKLFVNGTMVSTGPARGDVYYWNYETVDLAPYLKAGDNCIAAKVWNEAQYRPEAQNSIRTAFILQGNSVREDVLNSNAGWKCIRDEGYQPLRSIFAVSVGERVDMNLSIMRWNAPDFDDSGWPDAVEIERGNLKRDVMLSGLWMLVPSPLPPMELKRERIPALRKAEGMSVKGAFPAKPDSITIPANSKVTLLLDQTRLINALLTLKFSQGKDAVIDLSFAESLIVEENRYGARKGNRNDVENRIFLGRLDRVISNGQPDQLFTTLYWRTFRYVQLEIETQDEPLTINDIYGTFIGYPFKQESVFDSANREISDMLEIGWRTARLCAMDTYWDCPFYEQLQYIGDTRIQALISYYNTQDDRLARHALDLIDHSRLPEGVTLSRYPTKGVQIISTFSLWYIGMLHDYWMYRPDADFVQEKLTGVRSILSFFEKYQQPDGSLKNLPYWNFVDWAGGDGWFIGAPPRGSDGCSAMVDMQLLWAYQWAAEMEAELGMPAFAEHYGRKAVQLKEAVVRKYWDASRKLFADTVDHKSFSQHTSALAILTGLVDEENLPSVCNRLLTDQSLTPCTLYFKYYLNQALVKGGLGDEYMSWLDDWRNSMAMGLTTWPETTNLEYTRSDCHAWASSPNIEFFRTVLGIDSDAPGFSVIRIEPHLGSLTTVSGEVPHPNGAVTVRYVLSNLKWEIEISIPAETTGILIWKGGRYSLTPGLNTLEISD
ncbi:MAG: alpha-L-rhamnosidase N-terminal domain-containing protein [Pontiellaceae bacterium]|nr:alpha-L-rhamnosidase N-terminal domain-containing protein [Pontiellaceae bacterium]MBN2785629.1 alpha-L-rhamnosidase N-terminal domain-containing protein [Pontiellaceae bacterium]